MCRSSSCVLLPTLPPLWMFFLLSICASFHRGSQCDGGWWVPLIGLSWLPSRLACGPPLFHQAPSPHPSTCIVDGFKLDLYARANLRRRSSPCRYLAGTLSLSVLSPFSHSFSKGQLSLRRRLVWQAVCSKIQSSQKFIQSNHFSIINKE